MQRAICWAGELSPNEPAFWTELEAAICRGEVELVEVLPDGREATTVTLMSLLPRTASPRPERDVLEDK